MGSLWGHAAGALAKAQQIGRQTDLDVEDRADKKRTQAIQMQAMQMALLQAQEQARQSGYVPGSQRENMTVDAPSMDLQVTPTHEQAQGVDIQGPGKAALHLGSSAPPKTAAMPKLPSVDLGTPDPNRYQATGVGDWMRDKTATPDAVKKKVAQIAAQKEEQEVMRRTVALKANPRYRNMPPDALAAIAHDEGTWKEAMKPQDPKNPIMGSPEWAAAERFKAGLTPHRDPIADHAANRTFDVAHPLPAKAGASGGGMTTSNALTLQGHFNSDQVVKDAAQIATALRKIRASATDPSAAGDMSLLIGYMKLLDPGSVVREQEFATAAKSGSLPQQIQGAASRVVNGKRLAPEQRADFVGRAEAVARSQYDQFRTAYDRYAEQATSVGLDPKRVVYDPYKGLFDAPATGSGSKGGVPSFEAWKRSKGTP